MFRWGRRSRLPEVRLFRRCRRDTPDDDDGDDDDGDDDNDDDRLFRFKCIVSQQQLSGVADADNVVCFIQMGRRLFAFSCQR